MRVYTRLFKKNNHVGNVVLSQSFITFKPKIDHIKIDLRYNNPVIQSIIDEATINNNGDKMIFGMANYGHPKLWLAPYGNQVEFLNTLNNNYSPFLDVSKFIKDRIPGILHYIGYFPDVCNYQLYYYLGNNLDDMKEDKLLFSRFNGLRPDYYGLSKTYDKDWNHIKTNSFAIRIPFMEGLNIVKAEMPSFNFTNFPQYLNLSYRCNEIDNDFTVSWLSYDTTKIKI
jgi:hypothetical protein